MAALDNLSCEGVMSVRDDQIRFSVVVPAFNEAGYVAAALASLHDQDFRGAYEVIVVDNNSTDATGAIARSLGASVVHEGEPGVCSARQRGTVEARGQIVVSTDADTVHPRDWLSRIDARFTECDAVVAVAGPCRYQNPSWWAALYPKLLFGLVAMVYAITGRVFYLSATNTAFLRTAFPGYDTTMTQGGDELDLLRRLRRTGHVVWDPHNTVDTSSRRLRRGLIYNFFITFLGYYLLAYCVNRLSSRTVFGTAPAFRQESATRTSRDWVGLRLGLLVAFLATVWVAMIRFAVPAAVGGISRFLASK
jgi:glycosyltransferase involved in cell wall biosynthesis